MNSDRTQKVMVLLLAGLAIGISSFAHSAKPGRADLASRGDEMVDDDSEVARVQDADVGIRDLKTELSAQEENAKPLEKTLIDEDEDGRTLRAINVKKFNGVWTADLEATITSKNGKITGRHIVPISSNEERFERDMKRHSERAFKGAEENFEKSKKRYLAKKEKEEAKQNCDVTTSGKPMDNANVDAKVACFQRNAAKLSGEKKEAYLKEVVEKYMKTRQAEAYKALLTNDPTGASYAQARATLLSLQTSLTNSRLQLSPSFQASMQIGITTANARLAPFQTRYTQDWLASQHMAQMVANPNMPPAQRAQLEQQFQLRMNQASIQQVQTELSARSTLQNLINSNPTTDAATLQAANATVIGLQNDMRNQIATNSNLSRMFGSMINPAYSAASGNLLTSDPYGTNAIYNNNGVSSLASASTLFGTNGINTFDNTQFWNPNINNMANPALLSDPTIPAAFQAPTVPVRAAQTVQRNNRRL